LQLYVRDPVAQDVVDGTSWSGRQANDAGQDFLLVVDTSMGFNKVNPVIRRSVEYQVQLGDGGTATADLTVRYLNEAPPDGEPCTHGSPYNAEIQYADLLHDCYWNYLRVYVPSGSQLLAGSRHPLDPAYLLSGRQWDGETRFAASPPTGLALLENFILVPPGEELVFSVRYQLPSAVVVDSGGRQVYHLRVNKQAGLINQSLRVLVTVPEGREIIATTPAAAQLSARSASFELLGLVDEEVMVQYR
jgi:hypothetical protein